MGWTAKLFFSSALLRTNVLGNGVPSTPHGVVFFSPSSEARFKCRPHRQVPEEHLEYLVANGNPPAQAPHLPPCITASDAPPNFPAHFASSVPRSPGLYTPRAQGLVWLLSPPTVTPPAPSGVPAQSRGSRKEQTAEEKRAMNEIQMKVPPPPLHSSAPFPSPATPLR